MSGGKEGYRTNVSTATAMVTASPHHGDQQPVRKVVPMSIAGQSSPSPTANPVEVKTSASAEWSGSNKDVSECVKKMSPADPASAGTTATDSKADLGGVR